MEAIMADKVGGGGTGRGGKKDREREIGRPGVPTRTTETTVYRNREGVGTYGAPWTAYSAACGGGRGLGVNTVAGDARPTQSCGRSGLPHASCPTLELPAKICT